MAQYDNFQEVKKHKRNISNNTSETDKKLTKQVPSPTAVKMPPKAVLTRYFFAPLRTTDTETTTTQNTLPKQEAPRKPRKPPLKVMTSTTNLIRLQSDLKDHVKGQYEFRNT
jgi:hypothetical protein